MFALTADDRTLLKQVGSFAEPIEICDAKGKLLGVFVPANLERIKQKYAELVAKIDWAEIAKLRNEPTVPHGEVVAKLQAMDEESSRRKAAGRPFSKEEAKAFFESLGKNPKSAE
ncbi:MAG TPA: hypothetical protein VE988_25945 [Gemmataceae bacterium]|nr:hypothetical protein [Gemmataceae bacterium]